MVNEEDGFREPLRAFVARYPHGWTHHEWLELLAELTDAGVDTTDPDAIGMALEREHVMAFLEGLAVKGLGPRRREALAARFGRLWDLRHATLDDLAGLPSIHPVLAEALHEALR